MGPGKPRWSNVTTCCWLNSKTTGTPKGKRAVRLVESDDENGCGFGDTPFQRGKPKKIMFLEESPQFEPNGSLWGPIAPASLH